MKSLAILSALAFSLSVPSLAFGDLTVTSPTGSVTQDFTGFTGAGFAPTPSAGQLDSDDWRVEGLSDSDGSFGGTHTSGDFARGSSSGGVVTGGVYGFNTGSGNIAFGLQPGGSDVTPGETTLQIRNQSGGAISAWDIDYTIAVYNDQGRANSFNFAFSTDDSTYTSVSSLDFTTPQAADSSPTWSLTNRMTTISALVNNGSSLFLQWQTDDVSGSGSRDEFGLSAVSVSAVPEPASVALCGLVVGISGLTAVGKRFLAGPRRSGDEASAVTDRMKYILLRCLGSAEGTAPIQPRVERRERSERRATLGSQAIMCRKP